MRNFRSPLTGFRSPLFTSTALSSGGGGMLPPFTFPADEMLLGMGLGGISSFNGYYPFANVLWNGLRFARESGTGTWSQAWGELTTTVSTDVFSSKFAEGTQAVDNLPTGTYTVLNPDGLEIGVGWPGSPSLTGWTTATQFTFDVPASGRLSVYALWARGSVTNNNGPIQIIMPGRVSAFQAGDYWNPAFITFLSGLNVNCLRFMDWLQTYSDVTESWSEVPLGLPTLLTAPSTLQLTKVPFALIVDLCNRLNINPWICTPVRANQTYYDGLAAYLRDNLNPNLRVFLEFGNEVWNPGGPYLDARNWVDYYPHTVFTATVNAGIDGWTRAGHGLTTGEIISNYHDKANHLQVGTLPSFENGFGVGLYVEVVDADNFKLYNDVARTSLRAPGIAVSKTYKRRAEAGKTVGVDANFGAASLAMWTRFDEILGRNRSLHVLGTQGVAGNVTTNRLAPPGVAAATDMVSPATYYSGDWFIGLVDIASGRLTPKAWSRRAGDVVRVAVYADGSTPTLAEVAAGSGAGYIGHRDMTITVQDASAYTTGAAITGLTNSTSYAVFALMTEVMGGFRWLASGTATVSATTSTVTISDSYAQMAKRARYNVVVLQGGIITTQQAVAGGKPIAIYESSSDYFGPGQNTPAELKAWRTGYTQSAEAGEAFGFFYRYLAARGTKLANQFVDINAEPGVFNIAESFEDTSDPRYLQFVGFDGAVPETAIFDMENVIAADVATEPTYPAVVHTFTDATKTYSIFNGDDNNNFDIVGNQLRIVNGYNVNYALPTARNLTIEASNGVTSDYFTVSFATGNAWYESDALFAWSSIADTDNTQINPIIGGTLPRTAGAGAAISGGLWDMDGQVYSGTAGTVSPLLVNIPFLVAGVMDRDNLTTGGLFADLWMATGGIYFQRDGTNFRFRMLSGATANLNFAAAGSMPAGLNVYWGFYDGAGTLYAGINQTQNPTNLSYTPTGSQTQRMRVGSSNDTTPSSLAKHGSMQIVNRAGMTLAQGKAMVAKMQALHGIAP